MGTSAHLHPARPRANGPDAELAKIRRYHPGRTFARVDQVITIPRRVSKTEQYISDQESDQVSEETHAEAILQNGSTA